MLYQYTKTATLYLVCQNHGGQNSRAIRLLSKLERRLTKAGFVSRYDLQSVISDYLYMQYVATFASKLA